jgi:hypothetical protein
VSPLTEEAKVAKEWPLAGQVQVTPFDPDLHDDGAVSKGGICAWGDHGVPARWSGLWGGRRWAVCSEHLEGFITAALVEEARSVEHANRITPQEALDVLRPVGSWREVGRAAGIDVWHRRRDWRSTDTPEETALPPMLPWTDELRDIVVSEYREKWNKYLGPGEDYDISWPPDGSLYSEGDWFLGDEEGEEVEPAEWKWQVTVQRLDPPVIINGIETRFDSDEDTFEFGWTRMDPREVEYGPHQLNPERQLLYLARGQMGV